MSILKLAIEAPRLCGANNAERFGRIAELIWADEARNSFSVFAKNGDDIIDPYNRIEPAFSWTSAKGMADKKQYIMDLIVYAMEVHYQAEHGGTTMSLDIAKTDLEVREKLYPDVAAIQPVAGVRGTWA